MGLLVDGSFPPPAAPALKLGPGAGLSGMLVDGLFERGDGGGGANEAGMAEPAGLGGGADGLAAGWWGLLPCEPPLLWWDDGFLFPPPPPPW